MKLQHIFKTLPLLAGMMLGAVSCDYIHEDLEPCDHFLHFSYTYNMKQADAFVPEMTNQATAKQVELFIYDAEGKYLSSQTVSGAELEANQVKLDLQPGSYQLLAWAGLNETDYTWTKPAADSAIEDWQMAVDSVLASYTNRMNLACGDDMQLNTASYSTSSGSSSPTTLQTVAALATGVAFPSAAPQVENPYQNQSLYMELETMSRMENIDMAYQIVNAAMSNSVLTQNDFLTTAQLSDMQTAYIRGTKVFVLRDDAHCFIVPVQTLTTAESNLLAQTFASCISR